VYQSACQPTNAPVAAETSRSDAMAETTNGKPLRLELQRLRQWHCLTRSTPMDALQALSIKSLSDTHTTDAVYSLAS